MNPSDDGPMLTREEIQRIHNLPENTELGPCSCPVCDEDFLDSSVPSWPAKSIAVKATR